MRKRCAPGAGRDVGDGIKGVARRAEGRRFRGSGHDHRDRGSNFGIATVKGIAATCCCGADCKLG